LLEKNVKAVCFHLMRIVLITYISACAIWIVVRIGITGIYARAWSINIPFHGKNLVKRILKTGIDRDIVSTVDNRLGIALVIYRR